MISKTFRIEELVPKHIFEKRGQLAWEMIDIRSIITLDTIKERFPNGTITINNWLWGGDRNWSGLRTPERPDYSETSQHTKGAFDLVFSHYTAEDVRQDIILNPDIYPHVKGIELGVSWLHFDTRNCDKLKTFTA